MPEAITPHGLTVHDFANRMSIAIADKRLQLQHQLHDSFTIVPDILRASSHDSKKNQQ